jgi:ribonucleoside-diphosphate reductase alpha chain
VVFVYSTLSGDFTMVNEHFVKEMKRRGLWSEGAATALMSADGDPAALGLVPDDLKARFKVAFDVSQHGIIDAAAQRQRWIDQGQSLNLYYRGGSMKELSDMYFHAWRSGLKTTYYLRSEGASRSEKNATCTVGAADCESCQ